MSTEKNAGTASFSERLRALRAERRLRSREMAEFLGFSQPVYSRYENGRTPDVDTVSAIAEQCGVTVDYLLGRTDDPRPIRVQFAERMQAELRKLSGRPAAAPAPGDPPAAPSPDLCHVPADCDLPARLEAIESDMQNVKAELGDIRKLLISLLAEERARHAAQDHPPMTQPKAG